MIKKLSILLSTILMVVVLASCGGTSSQSSSAPGPSSTTTSSTPGTPATSSTQNSSSSLNSSSVSNPAGTKTITEALALANQYKDESESKYTTDKYYIVGEIKSESSNFATYGNCILTDGTSDLTVYGIYSTDGKDKYEALSTKPVVGDDVVLYGVLGCFVKDGTATPQMKSGWLVSVNGVSQGTVPSDSTDPTPITEPDSAGTKTITEALAIANLYKDSSASTYTETKYNITGEIKSESSNFATYGNCILTDGTNDLTVYGIYSTDGKDKYEALSTKPVVGDDVVLYGVLGCFVKDGTATPQMKSGWLVSVNGVSQGTIPSDSTDPDPDADPAGDVFNKAMQTGWTYITNNEKYPDPSFYSNGGLKLNFEGCGATSPTFEAKASVKVIITIGAVNENTKTAAASTHVFTVTAYNASNAEVGTAYIDTVDSAKAYEVTVTGTDITYVKIVMTGYAKIGEKHQNLNIASIALS